MMSRLTPVLLSAAAFAVMSGYAMAYTAQAPVPQFVKETCTQVMQVRTSAEMDGCVASLSDAMSAREQGQIDATSSADCRRRGLAYGTPEYSMCVLDQRRSYAEAPAGDPPERVVVDARRASDIDERFPGTFAARRRREENSCAQLGLDPGSMPFSDCVAGLDAAIYAADNPPS